MLELNMFLYLLYNEQFNFNNELILLYINYVNFFFSIWWWLFVFFFYFYHCFVFVTFYYIIFVVIILGTIGVSGNVYPIMWTSY